MATPLEKKFNKAVWLVRNGPPNPDTTNDEKLAFYALYKQATEGDVAGAAPWAVQLKARAKYDAWEGKKGMSKEDAMQAYIDLVAAGDQPFHAEHDALPPPPRHQHPAQCAAFTALPSAPRPFSQGTRCGSGTRRSRATWRGRERELRVAAAGGPG